MKHPITKTQWSLKTVTLALTLAFISIQLMARAANVTCYDEDVGNNGGGGTGQCNGVQAGDTCQVYNVHIKQGTQNNNGLYDNSRLCGLKAVFLPWPHVAACGQWNVVFTKDPSDTCCPPSQ